MTRLPEQSSELIDREKTITFTFDGKEVSAHPGDTIGSALYAAGRRVFSRSLKFHRRRGLMCASGSCANCLVAVDGAPGVRACTEPVRPGQRVEHMNASPSLEIDLLAATDWVGGPFTPPGYRYKTFMRPRRLVPFYQRLLRRASGIGTLPAEQSQRQWRTDHRRRYCDLLIVGGGVAGLAAALAASQQGASVVLVDDGAEPGGRLLWEGNHEQARTLTHRAREAGVEVLTHATALGHFDGLVAVWQDDTLHELRARRYLYATGALEQMLVFPGNDLPGVMLSGAARRLAALYSVKPGDRAVVISTSDRGIRAAIALHALGVRIVVVADHRTQPSRAAARLPVNEIDVLHGWTVLSATGRRGVTGAVLAPLASIAAGGPPAERRHIECDLVIVSGGDPPATALPVQAGATIEYDSLVGYFRIKDLPEQVTIAGQLAGEGGYRLAEPSGELAGLQAAAGLGFGSATSTPRRTELRARITAGDGGVELPAPAHSGDSVRGRAFVCFCTDVTARDVGRSMREGFDSLELCKRYTTATMGPCQGRMCQLPTTRLVGYHNRRPLADVGTTTIRPPWSSVPLGALAGRPFEPTRRSPIHARHRALGARVQWIGDWRLPADYGDPEGEALAVHGAAGLLDISRLGKLLVSGPQAAEFLDRLYPERASALEPGALRHGVLSTEAGRLLDDGVLARLDEQSFYVTSAAGGAGAIEQWFSWWLTDWRLEVVLSDVSQTLAAIHLAGPRARAILAPLTELDCSPEAFGYLAARQSRVAAVPCLLLRTGSLGELGYELHFPAAYGADLWDTLLSRGEPQGLRPVGLEAQRLLRLQKQHVGLGEDTDAESTPFGAALAGAVDLDRAEDFVGKWALAHAAQHPGATVLVGFVTAEDLLPREGAVVLDERGAAAGRVTTVRHSRQLGHVIGMAWVPASLAEDGTNITIADRGAIVRGSVVRAPFFDPQGELTRS